MKAIVYTEYGPPEVLQFRDMEKPIPKDHEVLVKVYATSVTSADLRLRGAAFPPMMSIPGRLLFGIRKPKKTILGMELAGKVEDIGPSVKGFKKREPVFASSYGAGFGAYAEYKCLPENGFIAPKPSNMTYEEAAVVPFGAHTAMHFLKKGKISKGKKVLINGAAGSVGSNAVQLAKYYGASVTGVCHSRHLAMIKSLGADQVIDYTKEDFTNRKETYDIIFDTVGKTAFSACIKSLRPKGYYLMTVFGISHLLGKLWLAISSKKRIIIGEAVEKKEDIIFIKELIEAGHLTSVVDRSFPLEQAAEAHRYVEAGNKMGSVVIRFDHNAYQQK